MTDEEFKAFHDARWAELALEIKETTKAAIVARFSQEILDDIRARHAADPIHWVGMAHHGWGTAVRNLLRGSVKDDRLPSGNWDDYYIAAVEYAAGLRSA